jgi:PAS domain-containing protein
MATAPGLPSDLRLVFHDRQPDGYELSNVLLATAGFNGELNLLGSGWERALGFERGELCGKTLSDLMWSSGHAAAAVAAILGRMDRGAVDLRLRCRDGRGKALKLHRHYVRSEQVVYIVGEELPADA